LAWNYRIFFRCSFSRKGKLSSFGCPLRYLRHVTRLHESSVTLRIWVLCECTHPSMSNVKCVTLSACILYTRNMYTLSVRTRARSLKGTENTQTHTHAQTHANRQTDRQAHYTQMDSHVCAPTHTNAASCLCVIMIAALTGYPQQVQS